MTNEELKKWHEDKNNFLNMEIDVNGPYISDVILIKKDGLHINCMTNKRGVKLIDVIQDGIPFIVYEEKNPCNYGYYVFTDKEHEMLVVVDCKAEIVLNWGRLITTVSFSWKEINRSYVSFKYGCYRANDINIERKDMVDICGQTLYTEKMKIYETAPMHHYPSGAKREIIDYIGGLYIKTEPDGESTPTIMTFDSNDDIWNVLYAIFEDSSNEKRTVGKITYIDNEGMKLVDNHIPMPSCATKALRKIMALWKQDLSLCARHNQCFDFDVPVVSILQNIDDKALLRLFKLSVHLAPIADKSRLEMVEFCRISLDDIANNADKNTRMLLNSFVIYMDDDFTKTILERSEGIIRKAVEAVNFYINKESDWYDVRDCLNDYEDKSEAFCNIRQVVNAAVDLGANNIVERIFNLFYKDVKEDRIRRIRQQLFSYCSCKSVKERLESMFGRIDETKSKLEDALMLPKGMLKYMVDSSYGISFIRYLKNPFEDSDEAMQYFTRLDKKAGCFYIALSLLKKKLWKISELVA